MMYHYKSLPDAVRNSTSAVQQIQKRQEKKSTQLLCSALGFFFA